MNLSTPLRVVFTLYLADIMVCDVCHQGQLHWPEFK